MKTQHRQIAMVFTVLLLVGLLLGCSLGPAATTTAGKPVVSISSPPSGAQVTLGQEVLVQATATDQSGVVRIELWVDSVLAVADQPPAAQPAYAAILHWTPSTPGAHTLMVKAINSSSVTSDPVTVTVNVVGEGEATSTVPALPTSTVVVPPTNTPVAPPTNTPVPPPTNTPPPPPTATNTSVPPPPAPTDTPVPPLPQEEYVDGDDELTVEQDMHVCPPGFAIGGVHVDRNDFLCRRVVLAGEEQFVVSVKDTGTVREDMHACPQGMYMRGLRVDQNVLLCSYDSRRGPTEWQQEVVDTQSVGYDMHICPQAPGTLRYLTGIRADANTFLCGIHQQ